jgi:hypothetical protein
MPKSGSLVTMMVERPSFLPLKNHISRHLSPLIEILTITTLTRDQRETKDLRNRSLLLFRTMTGLVMSKNGCSRDIRPKLTTFGDLLTPPDIALPPTIPKTLRETKSLTMLPQSTVTRNYAPSGRSSNLEMAGTLLWPDLVLVKVKRSLLTKTDGDSLF